MQRKFKSMMKSGGILVLSIMVLSLVIEVFVMRERAEILGDKLEMQRQMSRLEDRLAVAESKLGDGYYETAVALFDGLDLKKRGMRREVIDIGNIYGIGGGDETTDIFPHKSKKAKVRTR